MGQAHEPYMPKRKTAHQRGYDHKWRKSREIFLQKHPLCVFCSEEGRVKDAEVVDHIIPHRGNKELFNDVNNWQPLCKECHDSTKARIERGSITHATGLDGWPVED